ncbi:helix-turn-helix domain-containing protein [Flavobacterium sp.]|uniref:helix-turn-helix domain-containing protein n=1 Tax=Flavobacterium sp. TaxID=239 RepID=UPI003D12BC74
MQNNHTYNLPLDFCNDNKMDSVVYYYTAAQSSINNRISFSHNVLSLLLEGYKEVYSNNSNISIENNKFFMLQSGNSLMTEKLINNRTYASILFFFSDNFLSNFVEKRKLLLHQQPVNENTESIIVFEKDNYIYNFERSMMLLGDDMKNDYHLAETKLEEILIYLWKKNSESMSSFFQKILFQDKEQSFKDIIKQYELSNLNIDELAFLCNMSLSTFKRKFTETYNTSPRKYFIGKKMEKALIELQKNRRPSDIGFELGYENLSAFSNEFKKHFGVAPKHYSSQFEPK